MNVGSVKYHPGGPTCTYKGVEVPCIVEFSEVEGILGNNITDVLRHLDDLTLYKNDRENGIIPAMLVDGNGNSFDLGF